MAIDVLEHVTIRCSDLAQSRRFYSEVLDLTDGERPPFDFPGAWLYAGDTAVIHLVGGRPVNGPGTGCFDHIGLRASDLDGTRARLEDLGIEFTERTVPGLELHQVFVTDPDGVTIELNFPLG